MFQALTPGSTIPAKAEQIVGLHRSLNTPTLTLGGGAAVPCRAYIVGLSIDGGLYSLYVALCPMGHSNALLFRCDPVKIPISQYRDVEKSALALVKRHSFVTERVDMGALSPGDKHLLLQELPLTPPAMGPTSRPGNGRVGAQTGPRPSSVNPSQSSGPASKAAAVNLGVSPEEAISALGRLLASF